MGGIQRGLIQLCPSLVVRLGARHPASQGLDPHTCNRHVVCVLGPEWKLIFSGTQAAFDPASGLSLSTWNMVGAQKTLAERRKEWASVTVIMEDNNFAMRFASVSASL